METQRNWNMTWKLDLQGYMTYIYIHIYVYIYVYVWGFPNIRGSILGAPIISTIVLGCL